MVKHFPQYQTPTTWQQNVKMVELRYRHSYSVQQISECMGIPYESVFQALVIEDVSIRYQHTLTVDEELPPTSIAIPDVYYIIRTPKKGEKREYFRHLNARLQPVLVSTRGLAMQLKKEDVPNILSRLRKYYTGAWTEKKPAFVHISHQEILNAARS